MSAAPPPPVSSWDSALALDVLKQQFGHSGFRFEQERVLAAIAAKRDCLCIAATGAGKSLCFQFPSQYARARAHGAPGPHVTLVISPLLALMEDQVAGLRTRGIRAVALSTSLTSSRGDWEAAARGDFDVVYITPESLKGWVEPAARLAASGALELICIDEAHCVS